MRAPWTTNWPTPPAPTTSTVEPASTPAGEEHRADARQRGAAEQRRLLQRHARRRAAAPPAPRRRGARIAPRSPCRDRASRRRASCPSRRRAASRRRSRTGASGTAAGRPRWQSAHFPHDGAHDSTTSSPTATLSTPSPTASTTPAPSWPSTIGVGRSHSPLTMWRSVPQMPTAAIRTSTWPAPGSSSSMS